MKMTGTRFLLAAVGALSAASLALPAASAAPGDPVAPTVEAKNFAITQQRQAVYATPAYQRDLATTGVKENLEALAIQAADPERNFANNLCWNHQNGCAGDIRLYDWGPRGYGLVKPVLFTARNGATLSGHVWATRTGAKKRPGVVITNGSFQADEQMYWYAAQTLAKAGYVVLTFDPQGQGQSDTFGEGADAKEGFPAQTDGRPFYDGTEDALNFFLSTAKSPYVPVTSCTTGTSHAPKQQRRVWSGLNTRHNPFAGMIDRSQIGLAGHSFGAAGASYISQWDARVKAVVAWDNLGGPGPNAGATPGMENVRKIGEKGCPARPADRKVVPITKPGLGISADYGLPPTPNVTQPDPGSKSSWSKAYSKAGVDTGQIIIRGGSHLDFSFIPNQAFAASLRGPDLTAWYTTAWFDKYLKHDPSADKRLLTDRWRADEAEAAVEPKGDGNAFSFYYPSRFAFHRADQTAVTCENLRAGCAALSPKDGYSGSYSYVKVATTPDR